MTYHASVQAPVSTDTMGRHTGEHFATTVKNSPYKTLNSPHKTWKQNVEYGLNRDKPHSLSFAKFASTYARLAGIPYMSYISRKQAKVGFTKFSRFLFSRTGMWASFPDVLNLIFAVFNFANGHRLAKYAKLYPP